VAGERWLCRSGESVSAPFALIDQAEAFHAAYGRGRLVKPPDEYADLILIPAILHIDPLRFAEYPPMLRAKIRGLLTIYLAGGQGLNPDVIRVKD
jgi:hypothetical protein